MAVIANRRSVMTLFSRPTDAWSHRTRLVLAEKNINIDIIDVDDGQYPEDLLDLNPYNTVPTLVDRDLVLYDSRVIIEYLDERFPHPPLMPVDPVTRAQFRLVCARSGDRRGRRPQTGHACSQGASRQYHLERRDIWCQALFPE
jgi:RNA polymerase-associated protein